MPTRDENRKYWDQEHDWSDLGEVWTPSDPRWKEAILAHGMEPYLERRKEILEIGPGGGRWTEELLKYEPTRLIAVDIAPRCIELCRERFGDHPALELVCNDGQDLGFIGDETIDFIWSFDVFVHVEKPEVAAYFAHFKRVLRPGGIGVVHYATLDRATEDDRKLGWRAEFTSSDMFALLDQHGLQTVQDLYDAHISVANSSVIIFRKE